MILHEQLPEAADMILHAQLPEAADMSFAVVCIPEADELTQLTT